MDSTSLNGLFSPSGAMDLEDISAATAQFGVLTADTIIGGNLTYKATNTDNLTVNSELVVSGTAIFKKTVDFQGLPTSLLTSGSLIVGNKMNILGNALVLSGSQTIGSHLVVSGNITAHSTLSVNGIAIFNSGINVAGETTINKPLTLVGTSGGLADAYLYFQNGLATNSIKSYRNISKVGTPTIEIHCVDLKTPANLSVEGTTLLKDTIVQNLDVFGHATFEGGLKIDGDLSVGSNLSIFGSETIASSLHIDNGSLSTYYKGNDTSGATTRLYKSRNGNDTIGGDVLSVVEMGGYRSGAYRQAAYIAAQQNGVLSNAVSAEMIFATTNSNGITGERLRITRDGNIGIGTNSPGGFLDILQNGSGTLSTLIRNPNTGSNAAAALTMQAGTCNSIIFQNSENRASDGNRMALNIRNDKQAGNIHLQNKVMNYVNWATGFPEPDLGQNGGGVMIGEKNGLVYPASRLFVDYNGPNGMQSDGCFASNDYASNSLNFMDNFSVLGPSVYGQNLYFYTKDELGKKRGIGITLTATIFTGQHINYVDEDEQEVLNQTNIENYVGLIVSSTGKYKYNCQYSGLLNSMKEGKDAITPNDALPIVCLSKKKKDKSVWGVITPYEDRGQIWQTRKSKYDVPSEKDGTPMWDRDIILQNEESGFYNEMSNLSIRINGAGEGSMWVCNSNESLENGDYITSSNVWGYGEKQLEEFCANYTVAKITCDCNFDDSELEDKFQVRYLLDEKGTICEKGEHIYIACLVGCSYKTS